jgi:hypothetical protein
MLEGQSRICAGLVLADGDFCQGRQKLQHKLKTDETDRHDHSLERSRGALSGGTIRFPMHPFLGKKLFSEFFFKNPVLKKLNRIHFSPKPVNSCKFLLIK